VYSLVIPVYQNEDSIPELLDVLADLHRRLDSRLEAIFVVDGSPDDAYDLLLRELPDRPFAAKLLLLSRNFGSIAAIRAGLTAATGPYFAFMAADLQEPPELVEKMYRILENEPVDVTVGVRTARSDPLINRVLSTAFWSLYRRFIQKEVPPGGVDIFGCNQAVRDQLTSIREANTSLVGLLFWVGFRRKEVPYARRRRRHGKSGWSFRRRFTYFMDSVFGFSDLPIRLLMVAGFVGLSFAVVMSLVVLIARLTGVVDVPGYAATVLLISFFAGLNSFGLGLIGSYVWRAFENTKGRPESIVMDLRSFSADTSDEAADQRSLIFGGPR
jgi:glycosyltransferase involved in cell wall biosynthesis